MKKLFDVVTLGLLLFPMGTIAQTGAALNDEVLVTVRNADCAEALRVAPSPLGLYHRFPDFYLAGTSRATVASLKRRGITAAILDDRPWIQSYAVVAKPHPAKAGPNLESVAARILLQGDDFILIQGLPAVFQQLRGEGFVCIEVERNEIPFDATTTRLPRSLMETKDGHAKGIVDSVIALVSDTTVRNSIQAMQNFGTRYWSNANRDSVSRWLRGKFLETGIADVKLDSFQYSSTWQSNVIATIPGTVDPLRELIVGGHHDSYSSNTSAAPGADDNASGTTAAIEMARVLKLANYQPAYTIRFMGFAAEEAGLRGSASYASRARSQNRDIRAMLNYDMIANRTQSQSDRDVNVVWYTGSEALGNLHLAAGRTYTTLTPILSTSSRSGSDSYSFWQQNYKSVFLIERDFSPYYHTPNDLLQYLDMPYCRDIIRSGLATLITLDQMPPTVAGLQLRDCGNGTALRASWDSLTVLDLAAYKIYVGRIPGIYDTSYTQGARSRFITGLTTGVRSIVGVSIVDLAGREGMITEVSAIPYSVPQAPAGLVFQWTVGGVQLQWRNNMELDIRGYNVYRRMAPSTAFAKLNTNPILDSMYVDADLTNATRRYFVMAVDSAGNESPGSDTLSVFPPLGVDNGDALPFAFTLYQNYPNPFNPTTEIRYQISEVGRVSLQVFDLLGREVSTLVNEMKLPGLYNTVWNASRVSSGVYVVRLQAGGRTTQIRTVLLK